MCYIRAFVRGDNDTQSQALAPVSTHAQAHCRVPATSPIELYAYQYGGKWKLEHHIPPNHDSVKLSPHPTTSSNTLIKRNCLICNLINLQCRTDRREVELTEHNMRVVQLLQEETSCFQPVQNNSRRLKIETPRFMGWGNYPLIPESDGAEECTSVGAETAPGRALCPVGRSTSPHTNCAPDEALRTPLHLDHTGFYSQGVSDVETM
ncbi:hypothetical protein J6590_077451 [Homalodisca vitripennis]|nr:hypothetical protein J6590_077451 [Homalodisca vitripennis]